MFPIQEDLNFKIGKRRFPVFSEVVDKRDTREDTRTSRFPTCRMWESQSEEIAN